MSIEQKIYLFLLALMYNFYYGSGQGKAADVKNVEPNLSFTVLKPGKNSGKMGTNQRCECT